MRAHAVRHLALVSDDPCSSADTQRLAVERADQYLITYGEFMHERLLVRAGVAPPISPIALSVHVDISLNPAPGRKTKALGRRKHRAPRARGPGRWSWLATGLHLLQLAQLLAPAAAAARAAIGMLRALFR